MKKNWNKYPPEVQKFVSILLNLTPFLLQKINFSDPQVIDLMKQIESYFNKREYYLLSYAENPVMYVAMKDFDFIGPKPDASDLKKVSSFRTVHELIGASYRQMQSKKQNEYLRRVKREPYERGNNNMPNEDHEILVNITASEWRAAFEYAMSGTTDKHLLARYFLWQNYRFPNYAFELRTPLTPRNMGGNNYYFQVLMEVLKNSQ